MRVPVLLFLCMLISAAWGQVIPVPELPTPNAFDWYVKAGPQLVDKERTDKARERMRERDAETMALKAEVLKANAQALATLREGFAHRYQQPAVRHISTTMPYLAHYRVLTCLLVFEAQTKGEAGDWGGAMDSCLDAFRIGIDAPRGGVLISGLVGISCQAIAHREMWNILPHLTPEEARVAMARLQALHGTRTPVSATMEEEKWIFQATLDDMKAHPEKYLESHDAELEETLLALLAMPRIMDELQRTHGALMDALIAVTRQPYQVDREYPEPKSKYDAANNIIRELNEYYKKFPFYWARNETQTRLILTTLALRLYHAEHQAYPEKLSALPALPGDPFAKDAPFRYRRTKDGYLLYSVGPDGKDNRGTPVRDDDGTPAIPDPTSTGDIVAGVNCH